MPIRRQESIPLPRAVIERALATSPDRTFASLMERAFARILDGGPADRMRMMSAAVTLYENASNVIRYPCTVRSDQFSKVMDLAHQKGLNSEVLIAGAAMLELGMPASTEHDPHSF